MLYVQQLSSRALQLGLDADAISPEKTIDVAYVTRLPDKSPMAVETIGRSRVVVGFDKAYSPRIEYRVHLLLDEALTPGERYAIFLPQIGVRTPRFIYHPGMISPSIQVNQVGFLPQARKLAFAGNWLGSGGPMPVDGETFTVHDPGNNSIVLKGQLELVDENDPWSGNTVYRADFSALTTRGEYYLSVPGLGRSHRFSIRGEVFKPVFKTAFRLFYHSRNSTAIQSPWADSGFERHGGIRAELSAFIHPSVVSSAFSIGEEAGSYKKIHKGWFDAGDYGQYVTNAAPVWYAFGIGFDLAPSVFSADDMNLPESLNGVPDVIDELEWGMDWLLSMQNPKNGGVYSRVAPLTWDEGAPESVKKKRYLFEITTHASASFAAVTALHARLLGQYRPDRAKQVLNASLAAWRFLETHPQWPDEGDQYKNPPGVRAGEYPDRSAVDNRLWAAAELYRTTGETGFKTSFSRLFSELKPDPTQGVSFMHQSMAAFWSMYLALRAQANTNEADRLLQEKLARILLTSADWHLGNAEANPFRAPLHPHIPYTGWGAFAQSSKMVLPLLRAHTIDSDQRYCQVALEMGNPQLGANPLSISFITGIGNRSPRHPLSMLSKSDSQAAPLNGIPVNGPHYQLPGYWPATRAVNENYQPPDFPALRRYVDAYPLPPMSEPTVAAYALTAVAYGLLSSPAGFCR